MSMRAAFRTSNPALSAKSFGGFVGARSTTGETTAMTIQGTVDKTAILLAIVVAAGIWPWRLLLHSDDPTAVVPLLGIGLLGGLVTSIVTIFAKSWAPVTAPIYAACEGLVLGALSAMYEVRYPGIVFQAIALTFGTMLAMLVIYRTKAIRVTDKFRTGVIAATGAIALVYLVSILFSLFGVNVGFIYSAGPIGIGISLLVVGVAALNLVLDFDFVDRAAKQGAPKFMEWYGAFGLVVTLVWLYLELLRLLSKLRER
jgi:uncharacterized YccA/Bax inhibitor family protein